MATKRATTKGKMQKKDAEAFMTLFHKSASLRSKVKKGWNEAIAEAKKKGYKFSKQELRSHIMKRYGINSPPGHDEPDTCVCI